MSLLKGLVQGQNLRLQVCMVSGVVCEINLKFVECGAHVKKITGSVLLENIAKSIISVY